MMKQVFMSQFSLLWPGNPYWSAFCPLKPLMGSPFQGLLEAEASSVEGEIIRMLGARFSSLEKDLPVCQSVMMRFFTFSILFQILKYLGNLHSLIILSGETSHLTCLSYQMQNSIINFNHCLDVLCSRVSNID